MSFPSNHLNMHGVFNVLEFCNWARISRAQFYIEVSQGRIFPKKAGRRTLVTFGEAFRWVSELPTMK